MIYTVTSTLPLVHGGRTKSLLTRIRFLDKEMGIHNKILTTNYNANYNEVYQKFEENQLIRFISQVAHITKFWKNILTLREVFTVKNSSIHKRQMN